MSWMEKLYETYKAGMLLDLSESDKLMPISHTLQNAHIKITIDADGDFRHAEILEKTQIVLPATEKSAGRSSGEAPHPLADKIQYVAKDYSDYGGLKKAYFDGYLSQLNDWCNSDYYHPKANAVKMYISKGETIQDLVINKILAVNEESVLLCPTSAEIKKDFDERGASRPKIFSVINKDDKTKRFDQGNAMICWSVEVPGDDVPDTWKDQTLQQSWIDFELSRSTGTGLCYITGKQLTLAVNHPAKLRYTGDKAKLVSSNDLSGYTFRGRFTDSQKSIEKNGTQSVGIAFEVTQMAHNALRWLISRKQAFRNGEQVIVAWAVSGKEIPQPMEDTYSLLEMDFGEGEPLLIEEKSIDHTIDLGSSFASALRKYMAGYNSEFDVTDNIVIMGLDSATSGRMAVTYYQEFFPEQYIEQISRWHKDFAWFQRHKHDSKTVWSISAPAPRTIWEAIYGSTVSDSLKKNTIERILPCIVEARPFPHDLVSKAVDRACNRSIKRLSDQYSNTKSERAAWEKHLGIACSLYRGFSKRNPNQTKEYEMALEENNCSRDYLYGRLLAIAERIEEIALSVAGENRSTTAARLMQRFADRPVTTWRNIELALQPYLQRLKNNRAGFLHNSQTLLDEVMSKFTGESFNSDKQLSGEFLLAFHSQRLELRKKKQAEDTIENDEMKPKGEK